VTEGRYISQAERARRLIDKAVAAWQRVQSYAMANDDLVDSIILRGHELWLPHHETEGARYRVTLVVSLHYPVGALVESREAVAHLIRQLEKEFSDGDGTLTVRAQEA
jgi:hypothetical protein